MMGTKERAFAPIVAVSLEVLVTPKARDGQSTDARLALAYTIPLEAVAATRDR